MLRFDFNYQGKLSDELIVKVEELVNKRINAGYDVTIEKDLEMGFDYRRITIREHQEDRK